MRLTIAGLGTLIFVAGVWAAFMGYVLVGLADVALSGCAAIAFVALTTKG